MKKLFKKIITVISAITVCSVSYIPAYSDAGFWPDRVTPYTTSFVVGNIKKAEYHLWQEATDYFDDEIVKIYITDEKPVKFPVMMSLNLEWLDGECYVGPLNCGAFRLNEEDAKLVEDCLKKYNVEYSVDIYKDYVAIFPHVDDVYPQFEILGKIKEETGIMSEATILDSGIDIVSVENTLPEPTLTGDANEDGEVKLSDAVLIMQSLSNPDEYQLTLQGIANADMDGDGITPMDALAIQTKLVAE